MTKTTRYSVGNWNRLGARGEVGGVVARLGDLFRSHENVITVVLRKLWQLFMKKKVKRKGVGDVQHGFRIIGYQPPASPAVTGVQNSANEPLQ